MWVCSRAVSHEPPSQQQSQIPFNFPPCQSTFFGPHARIYREHIGHIRGFFGPHTHNENCKDIVIYWQSTGNLPALDIRCSVLNDPQGREMCWLL